MNDELTWPMLFLMMLAVSFVVVVGVGLNAGESGYKRGQIDALTGKITVELVEHPDGTKTWESKKGGGE